MSEKRGRKKRKRVRRKLKEDIRVFKDVSSETPFLEIHARNVIDFSAALCKFT